MSNTTTYVNFSAIDYRGVDSLSSYALDLTPITFIPDLQQSIHNRVVWNFGDGTVTDSFSATKSYEYPGKYIVNMIVYDCNNNAQISTFEKILTIHDYTPFTFNVSYNPSFDGEDVVYDGEPIFYNGLILIYTSTGGTLSTLNYKCGKINGPLVVDAYYPPYQSISKIFYEMTGSDSSNYWNLENKFKHLENFNTLYDRIYNYSLSSYQYRQVDKIEFDGVDLYAKIVDGMIVDCPATDIGSEFVGISSTKLVYLKEDTVTNKLLVRMYFDRTNNHFHGKTLDQYNNLGITLSANVEDTAGSYLSVTSNGMDGEGYGIDSFKINPIKYYNTNIPFVIKVKGVDDFSIKNFDSIELSALNFNVTGATSDVYSISSLNHTLSAQNHGGAFRGYITFPNISSVDVLENVRINVGGTFTNYQLSSYTLSGSSNYFSVYPPNYFDIYKKNEDFNPEETIKDLRFQETLLDKEVLFGDFIGGVLGNADSDHQAIGIKLYEKIANFTENTQDPDTCEVEFLNSIGEDLNYSGVGDEKWYLPEKIERIVDLLSIDRGRLFGTSNKFKENLDIKGRSTKDEFGVNIGDKLNTQTYSVSSGTDIVALEKFSNTYTLLNSQQPLSATGASVFPLSGYSSDWGWPLVLPTTFDFIDIEKYYLFFDYNNVIDGNVIGGVIDFENPKTTIDSTTALSALDSVNGIYDNMILDTLYQSLELGY
jgi:hypothetical protein|tara:strand:- start:1023 stop:3146 length:2124 start_codon:yes stop_codon:yes gene_type:complete